MARTGSAAILRGPGFQPRLGTHLRSERLDGLAQLLRQLGRAPRLRLRRGARAPRVAELRARVMQLRLMVKSGDVLVFGSA